MRKQTKTTLALFVMGGLLGAALSRIGFSSYDEVHAMFTFADLRLFLTFLSGVAMLTVAFAVVRKTSAPAWPPRPILKGTLLGGVLFGVGWALSGACPGVAVMQLGEGKLYALFILGGIVLGNGLYGALSDHKPLSESTTSKRSDAS